MEVQALYAGKAQILEPSGDQTGIFKTLITRAHVGRLGIDGDVQVDKRYHGGSDKALHQFAIGSYGRIIEQFPDLADKAIPGSIGENLSVAGMDEYSVCIGDIYCLGKVLVQVSEPRQPCWKINAKYGVEQLTEYIDQQGMAGWYYRVLEVGGVRIGDEVTLLERPNETITINYFNQIKGQQRPEPEALARLINAEGLAVSLKESLQAR
ncbi:MAG: MOSC domain-containing protein [Porticoccaceae bacterium]|nr:MOSC domain-containing protein [Porticoccaceae bacterium]